jgi:hypothetical protein
MRKEKTSLAVVKCIRLNPINPEEAWALEYLQSKEDEGFGLKETIIDALNARAGATPEMFTKERQENRVMAMVEQVMGELRDQIRNGKLDLSTDNPQRDDQLSDFTQTFGRGFLQRQAMTMGDDENGDE